MCVWVHCVNVRAFKLAISQLLRFQNIYFSVLIFSFSFLMRNRCPFQVISWRTHTPGVHNMLALLMCVCLCGTMDTMCAQKCWNRQQAAAECPCMCVGAGKMEHKHVWRESRLRSMAGRKNVLISTAIYNISLPFRYSVAVFAAQFSVYFIRWSLISFAQQ